MIPAARTFAHQSRPSRGVLLRTSIAVGGFCAGFLLVMIAVAAPTVPPIAAIACLHQP